MKPLYYRSMSSKGAGRPRPMHHHKGGWNETKWMRWVWRNGGMKFVVGENGRNPSKNLPRPRFVHHETHMEGQRRELGTPAVGGERLTACATRLPFTVLIFVTAYSSPWNMDALTFLLYLWGCLAAWQRGRFKTWKTNKVDCKVPGIFQPNRSARGTKRVKEICTWDRFEWHLQL